MPPRWSRLLLALYLLVLVWCEGTMANPADPDLWHRLAVGEYVWQHHQLPVGDTFSYLADYQVVADHEWGSGVIFYAAWCLGGGTAIVLLKLVTMAATIFILAAAGLRGRPPTLVAAAFYALILLALLPSFQSTVRCMVFTNLIFALWLYWYRAEQDGRVTPLWAYLLTIILWANLHGGFALGLAWLLGVGINHAVVRRADAGRWLVRFACCTLATLVNPWGWQLWISTGRALFTTRRGFDEWAPISWWPNLMDYAGFKILFVLVVIGVVLVLARRGWRAFLRVETVFVGGALLLALLSARQTPLFIAVAAVFLPDSFGEFAAKPTEDRRADLFWKAVRLFLLVLPLFSALRLLPGEGLNIVYPNVSAPVAAVGFLSRENTHGRLLVPFNYGSYALWILRGHMRVSMDGRYDLVYTPATYQRVEDFFHARGDWRALLHDPKPDAILLPISDPVYPRLKTEPGWNEAFHDGTDAVFLSR